MKQLIPFFFDAGDRSKNRFLGKTPTLSLWTFMRETGATGTADF